MPPTKKKCFSKCRKKSEKIVVLKYVNMLKEKNINIVVLVLSIKWTKNVT